jgi:hypothetical protein
MQYQQLDVRWHIGGITHARYHPPHNHGCITNNFRGRRSPMKRITKCGWVTPLVMLGIAATAHSQSVYQSVKSTVSDVEYYATNYGIFGLNIVRGMAGFAVPRGSGQTYIFGSGLWFGAEKKVGDRMNKLAVVTYNPNSGSSWAVPDSFSQESRPEPLYHSVDYDHATGQPFVTSVTASWPLWLRADQEAHPMNPGIFEPSWAARSTGGNYRAPAFLPGVDEQFVSAFNDGDLKRYEKISPDTARAIGYPIGLDIKQNIFSWKEGPFKDMVMIAFDIANVSGDTLYNCVAANMCDPDIGSSANDHCSYFARRPELRAAYAWTDAEAGKEYKTLAMSIIEAPVVDEQGFIDNSARDRYQLEGRVGTFRGWTIEEDPLSPEQRYDFIGDHTKLDADQGPGDKRALIGSNTFSMRPGDVAHFTVLFGVVDGRPSEIAVGDPSEFEKMVELANVAYYSRGSFLLSAPREAAVPGGSQAVVIPNPASGIATIRFSSGAGAATLRVTNGLGEVVMVRDLGRLERGMHDAAIDVGSLPSGPYLVSVAAGSTIATTKLTVAR